MFNEQPFSSSGPVRAEMQPQVFELARASDRPSWQGGPHWASNFRSFHDGGAHFVFCDGAVRYINESIDMKLYRDLSTVMGGELVKVPE